MIDPANKIVAVVGTTHWETRDAMNGLARDLAAGGGLAAKIFNLHHEDQRHVGLRNMIRGGHIGGLAIVNFSHDFHLRIEPDESVRTAALHVAEAGLPIFVQIEESTTSLGLEDFPAAEIISLGDPEHIDVGIITDRLLNIGVT